MQAAVSIVCLILFFCNRITFRIREKDRNAVLVDASNALRTKVLVDKPIAYLRKQTPMEMRARLEQFFAATDPDLTLRRPDLTDAKLQERLDQVDRALQNGALADPECRDEWIGFLHKFGPNWIPARRVENLDFDDSDDEEMIEEDEEDVEMRE